jgi:hypothetical protein
VITILEALAQLSIGVFVNLPTVGHNATIKMFEVVVEGWYSPPGELYQRNYSP